MKTKQWYADRERSWQTRNSVDWDLRKTDDKDK